MTCAQSGASNPPGVASLKEPKLAELLPKQTNRKTRLCFRCIAEPKESGKKIASLHCQNAISEGIPK
jgi:hypothetical protein